MSDVRRAEPSSGDQRPFLRSWAAMHLVGRATACWLLAIVVEGVGPRAEVPLPLASASGRTAPVALLVPLVTAAGAQFAVWHDAAWLLRLASRRAWCQHTTWAMATISVALLVTGAGAWFSDRVTWGAGARNCLVFSSVAVLASLWLAPGPSLLPAAVLALVALTAVSLDGYASTAQAWNWLAQTRATPVQLGVATAMWAAAVVSICLRRPHLA